MGFLQFIPIIIVSAFIIVSIRLLKLLSYKQHFVSFDFKKENKNLLYIPNEEEKNQKILHIKNLTRFGLSCAIVIIGLIINSFVAGWVLIKNLRQCDNLFWVLLIVMIIFPIWFISFLVKNPFGEGPLASIIKFVKDENKKINLLSKLLNVLGGISFYITLFAGCTLLIFPDQTSPSHIYIQNLSQKIFQSRLILFTSSFTLACGVVVIYFFYSWPIDLVNESDKRNIRILANSLITATGVIFTFLLVLVFSPITILHQYAIFSLVWSQNGSEGFDRQHWLENHNLDFSGADIIMKIFLTALPALIAILMRFYWASPAKNTISGE